MFCPESYEDDSRLKPRHDTAFSHGSIVLINPFYINFVKPVELFDNVFMYLLTCFQIFPRDKIYFNLSAGASIGFD